MIGRGYSAYSSLGLGCGLMMPDMKGDLGELGGSVKDYPRAASRLCKAQGTTNGRKQVKRIIYEKMNGDQESRIKKKEEFFFLLIRLEQDQMAKPRNCQSKNSLNADFSSGLG